MAFNRTNVELKYIKYDITNDAYEAFNRTNVELKWGTTADLHKQDINF